MNTFNKPARYLLLILLTVCFNLLHADDTEVYLGSNSLTVKVRPNVLFIIDSSGSMRNDVRIEETSTTTTTTITVTDYNTGTTTDGGTTETSSSGSTEYDPNTTYAGDCDSKYIYASKDGTAPDCSLSKNDLRITQLNKFNCSHAENLIDTNGLAVGIFAAQFKNSDKEWKNISKDKASRIVDCENDEASGSPYARDDDNDGYTNDSSNNKRVDWHDFNTYTFYGANYLNWLRLVDGGGGDPAPDPVPDPAPGTPPPDGTTTTTTSSGNTTTTTTVTNSTVANVTTTTTVVTVTTTQTVTKTRLEVVQQVFSTLMDSVNNINVGVMRFNDTNRGGKVIIPMQQLTAANRPNIKTTVNSIRPEDYTPLAETLYEAYLYFKGAQTDQSSGNNHADAINSSIATETFLSPIEYQCQKNFVILLTDGEPTSDTDRDTKIKSLPGFSTVTGSSNCSGNCLDELADYMHAQDCRDDLSDKQNVITYTIGFATDQTLLKNTAQKGGGKYYTADNISGLTDAFTSIITEILSINTTFIAPAVSVNAFNRFTHRDELYYALFRPNAQPYWNGNVKRFKLAGGEIVDVNDTLAIDVNTGFFKTSATSYWTSGADIPDGDDVTLGGAASKLAFPRKIYTYTGSASPNNADLTTAANKLISTNTSITKTMLGDAGMTDDRRLDLIKWASGVDLLDEDGDDDTTDIRRYMSDPLHAKPVLLTYGGTEAAPDMTLFAATNEGILHAIDTDDGTEVFSFMPPELLSNVAVLLDDVSSDAHPYGLDGPLTYWFNDLNNNKMILDSSNSLETGEFIYLYQAMRRGGNNYYALDVSNRSAPKYKWIIKGGAGGTSGFNELAQTWSEATPATIKFNGQIKKVLFFGGGYDSAQDTKNTASDDTKGRAIFMVDATTGAKLWQAGPTGLGANYEVATMTNSIPANLTVIDVNGDGYHDRIYAADMRAQIFRFDINLSNTGAANFATGGVIAQLGGNTVATNRRFYYSPDISLSPKGNYLNIAIGSGYRAHPLNAVIEDAFFVIRDSFNAVPIAAADVITMSDLYDATANTIGQGTAANVEIAISSLASSNGWYISLQESNGTYLGEKVLSKSLTLNNNVMFTTYTPVIASQASACAPSQGQARFYLVSVEDATPVIDSNNSGGDLTREDRENGLTRGGIPPEATPLFTTDGVVTLVGTEKVPSDPPSISSGRTYWQRQTD